MYFMDGTDVWVRQSGNSACFHHEPVPGLLIAQHFRRKELQGHWTAKFCILGFIHHPHSAPAYNLDDAELAG
jgi:hypothetical protein